MTIEWAYKGMDRSGAFVQGKASFRDEKEAMLSLQRQGIIPFDLSAASQGWAGLQDRIRKKFNKVKLEELIVFTRQFYTLFKAGLGVDGLLLTLAKQCQNKTLKDALLNIREDVQNGASLSSAFGKFPDIFDNLYISMLVAGEEAGILEDVLKELANVLEKEDRLRRGISSAMLYPKIVLGVMAAALYVMTTFIIPKFSSFFSKFGADLPLPTRMLMGISQFASEYWYAVLLALAALFVLFRRYKRTPRGKLQVDRMQLRAPIFGPLLQKIAMARFGHLFAALYRSGLPLVKTFEILTNVIGNEVYCREIRNFREGILKGKTISEVMRESKDFSIIMVEATAIGEQSGNLDNMLSSMAEHFDMEVGHITKNLTTLLEPILLMILFGMVTLMALGIFMPMWNLSKVVMK